MHFIKKYVTINDFLKNITHPIYKARVVKKNKKIHPSIFMKLSFSEHRLCWKMSPSASNTSMGGEKQKLSPEEAKNLALKEAINQSRKRAGELRGHPVISGTARTRNDLLQAAGLKKVNPLFPKAGVQVASVNGGFEQAIKPSSVLEPLANENLAAQDTPDETTPKEQGALLPVSAEEPQMSPVKPSSFAAHISGDSRVEKFVKVGTTCPGKDLEKKKKEEGRESPSMLQEKDNNLAKNMRTRREEAEKVMRRSNIFSREGQSQVGKAVAINTCKLTVQRQLSPPEKKKIKNNKNENETVSDQRIDKKDDKIFNTLKQRRIQELDYRISDAETVIGSAQRNIQILENEIDQYPKESAEYQSTKLRILANKSIIKLANKAKKEAEKEKRKPITNDYFDRILLEFGRIEEKQNVTLTEGYTLKHLHQAEINFKNSQKDTAYYQMRLELAILKARRKKGEANGQTLPKLTKKEFDIIEDSLLYEDLNEETREYIKSKDFIADVQKYHKENTKKGVYKSAIKKLAQDGKIDLKKEAKIGKNIEEYETQYINGQFDNPNSLIYKDLDVIQKEWYEEFLKLTVPDGTFRSYEMERGEDGGVVLKLQDGLNVTLPLTKTGKGSELIMRVGNTEIASGKNPEDLEEKTEEYISKTIITGLGMNTLFKNNNDKVAFVKMCLENGGEIKGAGTRLDNNTKNGELFFPSEAMEKVIYYLRIVGGIQYPQNYLDTLSNPAEYPKRLTYTSSIQKSLGNFQILDSGRISSTNNRIQLFQLLGQIAFQKKFPNQADFIQYLKDGKSNLISYDNQSNQFSVNAGSYTNFSSLENVNFTAQEGQGFKIVTS